ncbi:MAG: phage tail sheath family protein [Oscillospiraceae bacterium]|nr:phage tail sheath family protein [Oscillospiraceae bacterium]
MAGGIWTSQNKVLPGVYINVKSQPSANVSIGTRGVVAICEPLSWGATGTVMRIKPGEDLRPYIGHDITAAQALFLREMMKGSDTTSGPIEILLYRPAGTGGVAATATIGNLVATAQYVGVRGNDITVAIIADPDNAGYYNVQTVVDGSVVDDQYVNAITSLTANAWVSYSGSGTLAANAGTALTGGVDPTVAAADYSAFLTAIEPYTFDIITYDGTTATVITAIANFVQRMNESIGRKCQAVMAGSAAAVNSKYVIAVQNGVVLNDGTQLTAQQATYWVAGVEAGALYHQSLTYAQYPGAIEANPKMSDAELETAIAGGMLCFTDTFDIVKICTDINTKTTISVDEGAEFKKNRVMRVVNQFCNDVYEYFSASFIGKVDNNASGRALLRAWIIGYMNEMQANNGIQNFVAEDVSVAAGTAIDAVVINVAIQPVDAIEKIYMTVTVSANGAVA